MRDLTWPLLEGARRSMRQGRPPRYLIHPESSQTVLVLPAETASSSQALLLRRMRQVPPAQRPSHANYETSADVTLSCVSYARLRPVLRHFAARSHSTADYQ